MRASRPWRPTREDLDAAYGKKIRDLIAPDLRVLFCGINPSLYSGAVGHHFARPGNRFWPALHGSGFTSRLLSPFEEAELLEQRLGITNLVPRATAAADELSKEELIAGGRTLARKVARRRPRCLAFLGVASYRTAFGAPRAHVGLQSIELGETSVWLLPNPSGLNAHYQLPDLIREFERLRRWVDE